MLEVQGISKRFGDVVALAGCSFNVAPGRVVGFLGRNGSGKTTTMRGIFGLVRLDDGRVLWQGRTVTPTDRLRFGYMPEERGLYPRMKVLEQLCFLGCLHGMSAAAAAVEASRWLDRLELGERAGDKVDSLSHGNQQRVQLAAALIAAPDLLVLDEPFSGLDPIASATLISVIREQAEQGVAVVFSSHQLDLIEDVCDEIAVLTRGHVVLSGALAAIRLGSKSRFVDARLTAAAHPTSVHDAIRPLGAELLPAGLEGRLRLRVAAATDPKAVLAALARLGQLEYFRFEPPSLEDIFREAVGE